MTGPAEDGAAASDRSPTPGPLRVVHVDPDPDYRLLIRLALGPEDGLELVGEAASLADGCAEVARVGPDVVLVEPYAGTRADLDGLVRLAGQVPGLRTVVLTSLPPEDTTWPTAGGALGVLSKALRPTHLATELRELLLVLDVVGGALDEVHTHLEPDVNSPRQARAFVTDTLERWSCRDATAIIDLLVSEMVANAVLHAGTEAELAVQLLPDRVRVSVTDHDPSQPKRRPDNPALATGRGLALIEKLSVAWGIDRLPTGKRMWFETLRPDGSGEPA
jgi:anti-sigma regulatory factor (Ser/Thr protein kinase)